MIHLAIIGTVLFACSCALDCQSCRAVSSSLVESAGDSNAEPGSYCSCQICHVSMAPPLSMKPRCARRRVLDPCHMIVFDRTTATAMRHFAKPHILLYTPSSISKPDKMPNIFLLPWSSDPAFHQWNGPVGRNPCTPCGKLPCTYPYFPSPD